VRVVGVVLVVLVAAAAAAAQTVSVQSTPAPHYAGEPIEIHVIVEGFEENPAPSVVVASPPRGRLIAGGVHPSVSTSISIVNGQMRRTKEVKFTFVYQLHVAEPGRIEIGPFAVTQGHTSITSRSLSLDLKALPTSDQMAVEMEFPNTPVYVGERVPITLRFRLTGRLRENLHQYALRVPFFALTETFQFLEPPDAAGTTQIEIQIPSGPLSLYAWLGLWVTAGALVHGLSIRFLFRFPDDRPPAGRWHAVWPWFFAAPAGGFNLLLFSRWAGIAEQGFMLTAAAGAAAMLAVATYKYRQGDRVARRQMRWVLLGVYLAALPVGLAAAATVKREVTVPEQLEGVPWVV